MRNFISIEEAIAVKSKNVESWKRKLGKGNSGLVILWWFLKKSLELFFNFSCLEELILKLLLLFRWVPCWERLQVLDTFLFFFIFFVENSVSTFLFYGCVYTWIDMPVLYFVFFFSSVFSSFSFLICMWVEQLRGKR